MRHIPNLLSTVRIVLAVPIVLLLREGEDAAAVVLLVVALLTDGADGYAARRWGAVSESGKILDPLADKIVAAATALSLWLWRGLPGWFLLVVVARDLLLLAGGALLAKRMGRVPSSRPAGKIAFNVLVAVLLIWLLRLESLFAAALAIGTALLALSLLLYAVHFRRVLAARSTEREIP